MSNGKYQVIAESAEEKITARNNADLVRKNLKQKSATSY